MTDDRFVSCGHTYSTALTNDKDEQNGCDHEADVFEGAWLFALVGLPVVVEVLAHSVGPCFLLHIWGEFHFHLTVSTLHVLSQTETGVGARLPVELRCGHIKWQ